MSPVQYQRKIRLQEARSLMLSENLDNQFTRSNGKVISSPLFLCPLHPELEAVALEGDPVVIVEGDPARQGRDAAGEEHGLGLEGGGSHDGAHVCKVGRRED
jgi:hypothetical protein